MNEDDRHLSTKNPCTCHFLEKCAEDPSNPIIFEERTGEYHLIYSENNVTRLDHLIQSIFGTSNKEISTIIRYCPNYGGMAPESKRSFLFERISRNEELRLTNMLNKINTIDEAVDRLGAPEFDGFYGIGTGYSGNPHTVEQHRMVRFLNCSETAIVVFMEKADGSVFWQLQGKPKPKEWE